MSERTDPGFRSVSHTLRGCNIISFAAVKVAILPSLFFFFGFAYHPSLQHFLMRSVRVPKCEQSENCHCSYRYHRQRVTPSHGGRRLLQKTLLDMLERASFAGGEGAVGSIGESWALLAAAAASCRIG